MPQDVQQFLSDLQSDSADVRFAAWRRAGEAPPAAIPQMARLAASPNPGIAKAAREALNTMVHSVGRQNTRRRGEVVANLLEVAAGDGPQPLRAQVFRLLSLVAGEDSAPRIAKWIHDPGLREEVVFCLERIPGAAATQALIASYREAKEDFKPRLLAALGHRRAEEAAGLCVEAMRSPNQEIAVAAIRAFGRIGRRPAAGTPRFPEPAGLTGWQKIERLDSLLRFADAQVRQGSHAEAMKLYKIALGREEEHWQCAAIIGISRMGTAEAAAAIFPKLRSANRNVRIAAETAWKAMAAAAKQG